MSPLPNKRAGERLSAGPVRYESCWAKTTESGRPGISVFQHCSTAAVIARLLANFAPERLRKRLRLDDVAVCLAALHDVGKVSPGFQGKCKPWLATHGGAGAGLWHGAESDHGRVTQRTLQTLLGEDSPLRYWAAIAGAHHGKLKCDFIQALDGFTETWDVERRRLVDELCRVFGPLPSDIPPEPHGDNGPLWACAGLITVADWLASDKRTFPPSKVLTLAEIEERAVGQIERIGFGRIKVTTGRQFRDLFRFPANLLQKAVVETVSMAGVYIIEGPMGCGKTEAALAAAYRLLATDKATGLYFALPTQTTSNRIHTRIEAFLAKLGDGMRARLIHGSSWLQAAEDAIPVGVEYDADAPHAGRDWFASTRRALLAPFGVGTVDQALLGVVAAKHFFVRQYALAGKVVVLDEVHSYDLYTGTLIDKLIKRLRELGATVIVLSATLTAARRRQLLGADEGTANQAEDAAYPLLSGFQDGRPLTPVSVVLDEPEKGVCVSFRPGAELAEACLAEARAGACVLWIRNTVDEAQATARELRGRNQEGGPEIGLFHARFPLFLREVLEKKWLDALGKDEDRHPKRPNGCVLVSTQVAEQSVDIDADLLVTDLAPTDMLLQRMGRLWRHSRAARPRACPEVWVQAPGLDLVRLRTASKAEIMDAFGKSARVYAPYVLLRTLAQWQGQSVITLPGDIRPLLQATYDDPSDDEPDAWRELHAHLEKQKRDMARRALGNSTPWQVALEDEEGIQTRWNGCPRTPILPLVKWGNWTSGRFRLLDPGEPEVRVAPYLFSFAAAKAIHRNIVQLPAWTVRGQLNNAPHWLAEHAPRGTVPLKLMEDGTLRTLTDGETCLVWNANDGIVIRRAEAAVPSNHDRTRREEDDDESYD